MSDVILVIGVGNAWRRDDGAGPAVVERLAAHPRLRTLVLPGEGSEVIEAWRGCDRVIIVDAMRSGAPVGTIRQFDAATVPLPTGEFPSLSHRFGLAEAVEMARILDRLPRHLEVWGIEAGDVGQGPGLSPEVEAAVAEVVARIGSAYSITAA